MDTPLPKPSRVKKIARRAVFVLALLVTLGALWLAEENWRGRRAWHNYKSAMEAKGERFDGARLIPPKVPDDENFAACPYLNDVFEKPPESPGWTNNIGDCLTKYPTLPQRAGWPYGSSADLANWAANFESGAASGKLDPAQAAAVILDHLKAAEPVLAELRAASRRRYCRFNVPYEGWESTNSRAPLVMLQHLAVFKGLCRVLTLHAEAEMAAGRSDQALDDINVMFRLDDGLKDEPLLISHLVRYASTAIRLQPIAEGLAERRWSDAQLRSLQERLGRIDMLAGAVRALYGERDLIMNPFFTSGIMKLLGWGRLEQINCNQAFQEVLLPRINLAGREVNPSVGHACDLILSNYTQGGRVTRFIHHRIMAAMFMPGVGPAFRLAAAAQTDVDLLTVACALERYRLAEGVYPGQLAALSPRFITTLPHDIINGQPLKYRLTPGGKFVLYSVGWNEKDDGGVTATNQYGNPDRLQGDWVLEYPD
jgi:hypothetical protein